jgi:hypothetical protein
VARRRADLTAKPLGALKRPRIGPCRDMLELWYLEWEASGQVWRRYYANRPEARLALRIYKAEGRFIPSGSL